MKGKKYLLHSFIFERHIIFIIYSISEKIANV